MKKAHPLETHYVPKIVMFLSVPLQTGPICSKLRSFQLFSPVLISRKKCLPTPLPQSNWSKPGKQKFEDALETRLQSSNTNSYPNQRLFLHISPSFLLAWHMSQKAKITTLFDGIFIPTILENIRHDVKWRRSKFKISPEACHLETSHKRGPSATLNYNPPLILFCS